MAEAYVRTKRRTIVMAIVCAAWAVFGQVLSCKAGQLAGPTHINDVREGLAYRASAVRSLSGTGEMKFTFSPGRCERRRKQAEEYAKKTNWIGEVLPLDPTHESHLEFSVDFDTGRWRCDMVDLTVSGHNMLGSGHDPALNRSLPPEAFRWVSVSDGVKIYDYHQSPKEGSIRQYLGESRQMPQPLGHVRTMVRGVSSSVAGSLIDPRYVVTFLGEEDTGGDRCLKIQAGPKDPTLGGPVVRLWVAPELDFAVVREEYDSYFPASPVSPKPVLDMTWVTVASDFVNVSGALWCPATVESTQYRYRSGEPEGADPWEYTRVVHIKSIEIDTPFTGIITPYPFPEGTKVTDLTSGTVSVVGEEGK